MELSAQERHPARADSAQPRTSQWRAASTRILDHPETFMFTTPAALATRLPLDDPGISSNTS
ncbi:MAG TPA: hypothetical protein VFE45_11375, partial [Coriobacteriia bacterium]|nr:hypothetical protein [Coriobacteriia bacterium]